MSGGLPARSPGLSVGRLLWLWGPVIVYMALIHLESSMSDPGAPPGVSDKLLHVLAFGGLALVTLRALAGGRWAGVTRWTLVGCCLITLLYGMKDEVHQAFTPGRTPDVLDAAADLAGAVVAASGAKAWSIIKRL